MIITPSVRGISVLEHNQQLLQKLGRHSMIHP